MRGICYEVSATPTEQFFLPPISITNSCQHGNEYIILKAKQGQQIHVTVYALKLRNTSSVQFGGIVDQGLEHHYDIGTDTRGFHQGIYTSKSHEVTLDLKMSVSAVITFYGKLLSCLT